MDWHRSRGFDHAAIVVTLDVARHSKGGKTVRGAPKFNLERFGSLNQKAREEIWHYVWAKYSPMFDIATRNDNIDEADQWWSRAATEFLAYSTQAHNYDDSKAPRGTQRTFIPADANNEDTPQICKPTTAKHAMNCIEAFAPRRGCP